MYFSVLLVEDDAATARLLRRLLEGVGITVQRAATAAEAITALQSNPALVVMDLMLAGCSGIEVLRHVRRRNLACKVAVVSGAMDPTLLAEVASLKPEAVFCKPLEFKYLLDWMSSLFTEDLVMLSRRAG
jgi:CheY-like chemotaxis protein